MNWNRSIFKSFFFVALTGLLYGCSHLSSEQTPQVPAWVASSPEHHQVIAKNDIQTETLGQARMNALAQARKTLNAELINQVDAILAQQGQQAALIIAPLHEQIQQRVRDTLEPEFVFDLVIKDEWHDPIQQDYYALVQLNTQVQRSLLLDQLLNLDQQLADYKHASYRGSAMNQIWSLAPVLPTLEARRQLLVVWQQLYGDQPELPHQRMAELMEYQLTALFNTLNLSMDALTTESSEFERHLTQGLNAAGFNVSALRPSIILEYYLEKYTEDTLFELVADIELLHHDGEPFAHFSDVIFIDLEEQSLRQSAALDLAFTQLGEHLATLVLDDLQDHIIQFNQFRFGR